MRQFVAWRRCSTGATVDAMKTLRIVTPLVVLGLSLLAACGTDTPSGPPGGPVAGPADTHCGAIRQPWTQAVCQKPLTDAGAATDGAIDLDADLGDAQKHVIDGSTHDEDGGSEYGPTLYGSSGADDDCKFDFSWTSTPIRKDTDVTFTVDVSSRFDGAKTVAANPYPEVYLDSTHPAPNAGTKVTDLGNGRYSVGPVRFDRAGRWTVRFHVYENCIDGPESPHSHVAFFVDVP